MMCAWAVRDDETLKSRSPFGGQTTKYEGRRRVFASTTFVNGHRQRFEWRPVNVRALSKVNNIKLY